MSKQKKEAKAEPAPPEPTKPKESKLPETITAISTLIGAIIAGIIALHNAGMWPFTPTPTPILSPTPAWTVTLAPTDAPMPTLTIIPTLAETPTPTATLTPTPTPTVTAGAVCPWVPFSSLNASLKVGQNCLNDLLSLGISEPDQILFYRERGMNIGVFGVSKRLEIGSELNVKVEIKELRAVRFLVLVSRQERGYFASLGFRLIREGEKRFIQLVSYDAQGFEEVISDTPELRLWGGNLTLTFKFNGPQVKAYVNNAFFGQTSIEFSERYLFLGYQVMSGGAERPYLQVIVDAP